MEVQGQKEKINKGENDVRHLWWNGESPLIANSHPWDKKLFINIYDPKLSKLSKTTQSSHIKLVRDSSKEISLTIWGVYYTDKHQTYFVCNKSVTSLAHLLLTIDPDVPAFDNLSNTQPKLECFLANSGIKHLAIWFQLPNVLHVHLTQVSILGLVRYPTLYNKGKDRSKFVKL
jgi:hypothetical protein